MTLDSRCCRKTLPVEDTLPTSLLMHHIHPQHVLQDLVDPLCLSICMQMISRVKSNSLPKPTKNSFQNLEVNFASLSDINFFRTPCNMTMSLINTYATSLVEYVVLNGMKFSTFVNLSTTTIKKSCCLYILGKIVMKSMEMTSHFHYGIKIRCSNRNRCLHSALTIYQSKHMATNPTTSLFRFNQY